MTKPIILIMGSEQDAHAIHMQQALTARGAEAVLFSSQSFPTAMKISFLPGANQGSIEVLPGRRISLANIRSLYWRNFTGVHPRVATTPESSIDLAHRDSMSTIRTFLNSGRFRCVNSWQAYEFHKEKPLQLQVVSQAGVKIPPTYVGNCASQILAFVQQHGTCIFKPVYGGSHAEVITPRHLEPEHMTKALELAPVTIQAFIPGTNIRTYVIDDKLYSAEIDSDAVDFREDANAQIKPVATPSHVVQQCLRIKEALSLTWTAIDWRRTPDGEYFFLEANPSPMFIGFESVTGLPITESLTRALLR